MLAIGALLALPLQHVTLVEEWRRQPIWIAPGEQYDERTGNYAFPTDEGRSGKRFVQLFVDATRSTRFLSDGLIAEQFDCGAGLVTVNDHVAKQTRTFELSTGNLVFSAPGILRRVGTLHFEPVNNRTHRFFDMSGKVIHESIDPKYGVQFPGNYGTPIWITPKRWLFLVGRYGFSDTKEVVDVEPGTWKKLRSAWLSDYAMGFHSIKGNPDSGPFHVFEASNRDVVLTGKFSRDWSRYVLPKHTYIIDFGKNGLLAAKYDREFGSQARVVNTLVLDPKTLKPKFSVPAGDFWVGENIVSYSGRVYSGRDGSYVGTLKFPEVQYMRVRRGAALYYVSPERAVVKYRIVFASR